MDLAAFKATLKLDTPPDNLDSALEALWQDGKGNWDTAHTLAQDAPDPNGAWVHAYLHRVEGDESNAGHWYRRAEKPHCKSSLPEEWDAIATALLAG